MATLWAKRHFPSYGPSVIADGFASNQARYVKCIIPLYSFIARPFVSEGKSGKKAAMELIETIVNATTVRLLLSDNSVHDEATEWFYIVVKTNPDRAQPLTAIQGDALLRARSAIDQALRAIADHLANSL